MIREIEGKGSSLDDYAAVAHLSRNVTELRDHGSRLARQIAERTVWMVSSTAQGGGVAEMLQQVCTLLRELGIATHWLVVQPEEPGFFALTKRLHNLIHGAGSPELSGADRALYDRASDALAAELSPRIGDGDILVVHDPQPLGAGSRVRRSRAVSAVWRSHIGLDRDLPQTRAAWGFLADDLRSYDRTVWSAPEYVPAALRDRSTIIHPGLDPLSYKNRDLTFHKLVGILMAAQLMPAYGPMLTPLFAEPARRLQPDGSFENAVVPEDLALPFRPVVLQVSRWDRLKGWRGLLDGFAKMKRELSTRLLPLGTRERRVLEFVRLVLAGPDARSIEDDPEAVEVLAELGSAYRGLEPAVQRDVAILTLPMVSKKDNALMVNVLQRCATVVAQNSLQEGFGLTVTEAMWKRCAVLGTHAVGIRQQIRQGIEGHLLSDPEDPGEIADALTALLANTRTRRAYGQAGQRRVHEEFLVFTQVRRWVELLAAIAKESGGERLASTEGRQQA
jgi:trehalose synthase